MPTRCVLGPRFCGKYRRLGRFHRFYRLITAVPSNNLRVERDLHTVEAPGFGSRSKQWGCVLKCFEGKNYGAKTPIWGSAPPRPGSGTELRQILRQIVRRRDSKYSCALLSTPLKTQCSGLHEPPVNRRVVGSSPTSGAINTKRISKLQRPPERWLFSFGSDGCFGGWCNSAGCFFLMLAFSPGSAFRIPLTSSSTLAIAENAFQGDELPLLEVLANFERFLQA